MADKKAKDKKKEPKMILEREYIVPLRSEWLKVATYKRANRAVKELKRFLVKHMKIYDRDLRKIKIENDLNNELRFRGMRKPPAKIKVRALKYDNDIVRVELVDIPDHVKYARIREEIKDKEIKKKVSSLEKTSEKTEEKIGEKKEDKNDKEEKKSSLEKTSEKEHDAKEKTEASREEGLKLAKEEAREQKHVVKLDKPATGNLPYKKSQKGR
ncbi:60S ribosomal protein L31 [Candidatus Pacearchaeota archaeon]|nr:60S ribosomal protein L31 [Candidatus Pacearchaeota archaeon]